MLTKIAHLATQSIRYLETGSGQPLVLLHAFPLSADQWLPQLFEAPPGWRLVAPDLRGFRGSGPAFEAVGPAEPTIGDYAADVLDLMSHLDIPRAHVCGLSMGGYVALALHRSAPERVSGLALANTRATADSPDGRAARDRMRALLNRDGVPAVARELLPKLLGATTLREQPDLGDAVSRLIELNGAEALDAALVALKSRPDATGQLSTIRCPTVVIGGEEDVLIPRADLDALAHGIAGARLEVLPRVGHLSNLENPRAFGRFLFGMVEKTAAS